MFKSKIKAEEGEDEDKDAIDEDDEVRRQKMLLTEQTVVTPSMVRRAFRELWKNESECLRRFIGTFNIYLTDTDEHPTDVFFIEVLAVEPSRFRPVGGTFRGISFSIFNLLLPV